MGKRPQNNASSVDELRPENVLVNWMTTVTIFQVRHNQITSLLTDCRLQQLPTIKSDTALGQCSIKQLESLLGSMQQELERLLMDMNQPGQKADSRDYQRLVTHTQVLDQLNKQAQKLLVLTSLSAS